MKLPIVVRIRVEGPRGSREIDAVLDTGAGLTCISWDTTRDIGYDPAIAEKRLSIVTANGVIEAPVIKIKSISIGELEARDVDAICHNIPEISAVNGLLGLSFLRNFSLHVDFKLGKMRIEDP